MITLEMSNDFCETTIFILSEIKTIAVITFLHLINCNVVALTISICQQSKIPDKFSLSMTIDGISV